MLGKINNYKWKIVPAVVVLTSILEDFTSDLV